MVNPKYWINKKKVKVQPMFLFLFLNKSYADKSN